MPNMFAVNEMQRQSSRIQSMTREQMWRNVWCMMGWGEGMEEGGLRPSGCLHQRLGASVPPESEGMGGGLVFKGERNYEGAAE